MSQRRDASQPAAIIKVASHDPDTGRTQPINLRSWAYQRNHLPTAGHAGQGSKRDVAAADKQ